MRDGKSFPPLTNSVASVNELSIRLHPQWLPVDLLGDGSGPIVRRPRRRTGGLHGDGGGAIVTRPRRRPGIFFGAGDSFNQEDSTGTDEAQDVRGIGCIPDPSDRRDSCHGCLKGKLKSAPVGKGQLPKPPSGAKPWLALGCDEVAKKLLQKRLHLADANDFFGPIRDQGPWNTCTAHVAVSALTFRLALEGKGSVPALSSLFVYQASLYLLGLKGDTGAHMRTALKALAKLGAPPEDIWPYQPEELLEEMPDTFACQLAQDYRAGAYYRLDEPSLSGVELVQRLKAALADGLPICFGLPAHRSVSQCSATNGFVIPLPGKETHSNDRLVGGHAMLMVGFDEDAAWKDELGKLNRGAFVVRNSWGGMWGDYGHAFLPYPFVMEGLTLDHWVILPK
jgi:hypothetical protein